MISTFLPLSLFKRISTILQSVSRCSTELPLCLWPIRSKSLQTMPAVIEYSLRNTSRRKRKAHCILNRMSHAVTRISSYKRTARLWLLVKSHLNYWFRIFFLNYSNTSFRSLDGINRNIRNRMKWNLVDGIEIFFG